MTVSYKRVPLEGRQSLEGDLVTNEQIARAPGKSMKTGIRSFLKISFFFSNENTRLQFIFLSVQQI